MVQKCLKQQQKINRLINIEQAKRLKSRKRKPEVDRLDG